MKRLTCADAPIQTFGLLRTLLPQHFYRLPPSLDNELPEKLAVRGKSPVGGRVRFRTDAAEVTVRMELETLTVDWAIALCGSAGAVAAVGTGRDMRYAGPVSPRSYDQKSLVFSFKKTASMEDVTVFLPRNEILRSVEIEVDDHAKVEAPTPYSIGKPIVFYGSSITEGGCSSRVTNAYPALLSKWLFSDYINLGFSGAARGEPAMARYIAGLEMSAFVYDYDHNAPSADHLRDTHEPFFRIIRKMNPDLPILILSKPDFDSSPADASARRDIIRKTYLHAVEAGDKHVVFLDGQTFFGEADRPECTVDGCHPNDLGFMRMAEVIYPYLKHVLK